MRTYLNFNSSHTSTTLTRFKDMQKIFTSQLFFSLMLSLLIYVPMISADEIGIQAFEQHQLSKAKNVFELLLQENNENITALKFLAKIAYVEAELDQAEDYILKAQKLAPENAEIHYLVASIMVQQLQEASIFSVFGYAEKALQASLKTVELAPEIIKYRQALMGYYLQAPGIAGGDKDLAMLQAEAIAKLNQSEGLVALATVYQHTDRDTELEALYKSAAQQPNNKALIYQRGRYYQSEEKYEQAITEFQKILASDPNKINGLVFYKAQYQLGRSALLSETHTTEGISAFKSYIANAPFKIDLPDKSWGKYRLGALYRANGQKDHARIIYREALEQTKDKALLKKLKRALKRLKKRR